MIKVIGLGMLLAIFMAGSALPALGATTSVNSVDVGICMGNAIEKRDSQVMTAIDTHAVSLKNAVGERKNALKTAWLITDKKERKEAIKKAWSTFKLSKNTARDVRHRSVQNAWNIFKNERIACKAEADGNGSSNDTN